MSIFCYEHHINEWRADTADCTIEQRGAYRELLDWYFQNIGRLPNDLKKLQRLIGVQSQSERNALAYAVARFFTPSSDGLWLQNRGADKILEKLKSRSDMAKKSAERRWNKDLAYANAERTQCIGNANHKPQTTSSDAIASEDKKNRKKSLSGIPDGFDDFWDGYPKQRAGSKEKAMAAYASALKRTTKEEINAAVGKYRDSDEVARGFAKGAAAWINDDRWTHNYAAKPAGGCQQGQRPNGLNGGSRQSPVSYTQVTAELIAGLPDSERIPRG